MTDRSAIQEIPHDSVPGLIATRESLTGRVERQRE